MAGARVVSQVLRLGGVRTTVTSGRALVSRSVKGGGAIAASSVGVGRPGRAGSVGGGGAAFVSDALNPASGSGEGGAASVPALGGGLILPSSGSLPFVTAGLAVLTAGRGARAGSGAWATAGRGGSPVALAVPAAGRAGSGGKAPLWVPGSAGKPGMGGRAGGERGGVWASAWPPKLPMQRITKMNSFN